MRLRDIAVPVPDGDIGLFAQIVEANELVVDECLEGANIEGANACGRVLPKLGQDAVRSTLSCVLKMASAAATWMERRLSQSWE